MVKTDIRSLVNKAKLLDSSGKLGLSFIFHIPELSIDNSSYYGEVSVEDIRNDPYGSIKKEYMKHLQH